MRLQVLLTMAFAVAVPPLTAAQSPAESVTPQWRPGPRGDLAFETSGFLRQTAYAKPDKVADQMASDGAYGPLNTGWEHGTKDHWLIEEQRYAIDAVIAGLSYHRQDLIERGEAIFDWGFRQERPDGSFDCPDRFHSMSFFVEAAAHAALLMQASDMAAPNQAWVDSAEPRLRLAARWMMAPQNADPGQAHDAPYTHRFYLDADALGETGVLLHDPAMVRASRDYVRRGIARQDRSGFNPEKGGWDTSYHAVGLLFAETYYTVVADDALRGELQPMIDSRAWLACRARAPRRDGGPERQHPHRLRSGARTAGQRENHELWLRLPRELLLGHDQWRSAVGGPGRAAASRPADRERRTEGGRSRRMRPGRLRSLWR